MTIPMRAILGPKHWDRNETMTAGELIAWLSQFPRDIPVCASWEGQVLPVMPDRVSYEETAYSTPMIDLDVDL